jgi:hypothetical protein
VCLAAALSSVKLIFSGLCACNTCRYLINNQTGLHLWYWVEQSTTRDNDRARPAGRKVFLAAHKSEELKVGRIQTQQVLSMHCNG